MKKYSYVINNLDCLNCALKVEDEFNKDKKIHNCTVNFNTSKITFKSSYNISLNELNNIVKKVEPDVFITTEEVVVKSEYNILTFVISMILLMISLYVKSSYQLSLMLIVLTYILLLYRPFINAIKLFVRSKSINENLLIVISCIGAFLLGIYSGEGIYEGIMVAALYLMGKILENKAINNSRKSIKNLIDIKEDYAQLKDGMKVPVELIKLNDVLIVKKGEKIPVDGIIIKGSTKLDMSSLSGESKLVDKKEKDEVLSGSINTDSVIEVKATKIFIESTVFKILELIEEATDKKTKTETFVAKFSKVYTPIVLIIAVLVIILLPLLFKISINESIYRGLSFLVISCPCAIAISIPLSYFTAIGVSSKNGILIKGSNYLDNLEKMSNIIFDKTGTLTSGVSSKIDIEMLNDKYNKDEVIDILLKGENLSNHPIAKSIMKLSKKNIDSSCVKNFEEISGVGILYEIYGKKVKVGNKKLCACNLDSELHLNIDGEHVANIILNDGIKVDACKTIEELKKLNIETYMFTGDKENIAKKISEKLNIDKYKAEMLPQDKYIEYEKIAKTGITTFVGDGENDSPVLKRADIGISMGKIGSNSAIEASDIVLINDNIYSIIKAIKISKYTKKIIKQNMFFAIFVKVTILIFSIFGLTHMWFAVFADTGVTVLTILNTIRIMWKFK